jgi:hypothetical protein
VALAQLKAAQAQAHPAERHLERHGGTPAQPYAAERRRAAVFDD